MASTPDMGQAIVTTSVAQAIALEALRGIEAKMIKFKVPMPNLKAILRFGIPPLLRYDPSDTLQTELDATHMVLTFGHMYQLRQNVFMGKSPAAAKEEMIDALEMFLRAVGDLYAIYTAETGCAPTPIDSVPELDLFGLEDGGGGDDDDSDLFGPSPIPSSSASPSPPSPARSFAISARTAPPSPEVIDLRSPTPHEGPQTPSAPLRTGQLSSPKHDPLTRLTTLEAHPMEPSAADEKSKSPPTLSSPILEPADTTTTTTLAPPFPATFPPSSLDDILSLLLAGMPPPGPTASPQPQLHTQVDQVAQPQVRPMSFSTPGSNGAATPGVDRSTSRSITPGRSTPPLRHSSSIVAPQPKRTGSPLVTAHSAPASVSHLEGEERRPPSSQPQQLPNMTLAGRHSAPLPQPSTSQPALPGQLQGRQAQGPNLPRTHPAFLQPESTPAVQWFKPDPGLSFRYTPVLSSRAKRKAEALEAEAKKDSSKGAKKDDTKRTSQSPASPPVVAESRNKRAKTQSGTSPLLPSPTVSNTPSVQGRPAAPNSLSAANQSMPPTTSNTRSVPNRTAVPAPVPENSAKLPNPPRVSNSQTVAPRPPMSNPVNGWAPDSPPTVPTSRSAAARPNVTSVSSANPPNQASSNPRPGPSRPSVLNLLNDTNLPNPPQESHPPKNAPYPPQNGSYPPENAVAASLSGFYPPQRRPSVSTASYPPQNAPYPPPSESYPPSRDASSGAERRPYPPNDMPSAPMKAQQPPPYPPNNGPYTPESESPGPYYDSYPTLKLPREPNRPYPPATSQNGYAAPQSRSHPPAVDPAKDRTNLVFPTPMVRHKGVGEFVALESMRYWDDRRGSGDTGSSGMSTGNCRVAVTRDRTMSNGSIHARRNSDRGSVDHSAQGHRNSVDYHNGGGRSGDYGYGHDRRNGAEYAYGNDRRYSEGGSGPAYVPYEYRPQRAPASRAPTGHGRPTAYDSPPGFRQPEEYYPPHDRHDDTPPRPTEQARPPPRRYSPSPQPQGYDREYARPVDNGQCAPGPRSQFTSWA